MLSQVSPAVSPVSTAAAPREQLAIIPLSIVRALSGTCTRSAVLIYCALAAHADRDGRCWPGRARLGDIAGLSERQVSRATAELERKGLLRKESLPGGRVDYYLAPLTPGTAPPDTGVTPNRPRNGTANRESAGARTVALSLGVPPASENRAARRVDGAGRVAGVGRRAAAGAGGHAGRDRGELRGLTTAAGAPGRRAGRRSGGAGAAANAPPEAPQRAYRARKRRSRPTGAIRRRSRKKRRCRGRCRRPSRRATGGSRNSAGRWGSIRTPARGPAGGGRTGSRRASRGQTGRSGGERRGRIRHEPDDHLRAGDRPPPGGAVGAGRDRRPPQLSDQPEQAGHAATGSRRRRPAPARRRGPGRAGPPAGRRAVGDGSAKPLYEHCLRAILAPQPRELPNALAYFFPS